MSFNPSRFLFFAVLFSLAVIPHGIFPISIIYTLFLFLFLFLFSSLKERGLELAYIDLFLIISIWIITVMSISLSVIVSSFIFTVFYISFMQLRFNEIEDFCFLKAMLYLFVFSYFLQMSYSMVTGGVIDDEGNSRLTLTIGDPNLSGLLVFIVVTIMYFLGWVKASIILSILNALLIGSRAFAISSFVFFVSEVFFRKKKISPFSFIIIQFVGFFFIVSFIANWEFFLDYIQSIVNNFFSNVESVRFLNLYDRSNIGRFGSFDFFINKIFSDISFFLNGAGSEQALSYYNSVYPHNSMIYSFSVYGVPYSLVFFVALYRLISSVSGNEVNLSLACGFTFYSMFLHGAYSYIFLSLLMISMMCANKINNAH